MKTHHLLGLICLLIVTIAPNTAAAAETSVPAPLASRSLLLDIEQAGSAIIAVGERGHVLRSDDQGISWQQIIVPTSTTLTVVTFVDMDHGFAAGHDQTILKTIDGGISWHLIHQDLDESPPLLDLFFHNRNYGYAVGAYGTFLETHDGGDTWQHRYISDDDFHLNRIIAVGNDLFIAGEAGMVYRSTNAGMTFEELSPDYTGSFFGLLPLDNNSLLLYGLRGHLFRSDDGGENWLKIPVDSIAGLTAGLRLDDGTLLITGLAGTLLISHDGGHTFTLIEEPERRGFNQLLQTTSGSVLAVGDFGIDFLSPDLFR